MKSKFCNYLFAYLFLFFLSNNLTNGQSKRVSKKDIIKISESNYESLKYRSIGPHRGGRSSAVTGVPGNQTYFILVLQEAVFGKLLMEEIPTKISQMVFLEVV